ncbi:hypothetical protein PS880_06165 [Pseudomonas fluorescens]|uniref:Uncharacterized protein n=1 Tax=Pseudomonas fluorescens TaxID=294 RepID=A0A5E7QE29_PSEFL|nr:hypothetical protein PS880_06165 [Pseudomonas fluorescens]
MKSLRIPLHHSVAAWVVWTHDWAPADDYFYAAEVVLPGRSQPSGDPGANVGTGRTKYRLHRLRSGGYAWRNPVSRVTNNDVFVK